MIIYDTEVTRSCLEDLGSTPQKTLIDLLKTPQRRWNMWPMPMPILARVWAMWDLLHACSSKVRRSCLKILKGLSKNHGKPLQTTGSFWCLIDWGPAKDAESSCARKCGEHAVAVLQLIWKIIQTTPWAWITYNTNLYFKHLQANASKSKRVQSLKFMYIVSMHARACVGGIPNIKSQLRLLQNFCKTNQQTNQHKTTVPGRNFPYPLPPATQHVPVACSARTSAPSACSSFHRSSSRKRCSWSPKVGFPSSWWRHRLTYEHSPATAWNTMNPSTHMRPTENKTKNFPKPIFSTQEYAGGCWEEWYDDASHEWLRFSPASIHCLASSVSSFSRLGGMAKPGQTSCGNSQLNRRTQAGPHELPVARIDLCKWLIMATPETFRHHKNVLDNDQPWTWSSQQCLSSRIPMAPANAVQ